jgi:hypothetical protein
MEGDALAVAPNFNTADIVPGINAIDWSLDDLTGSFADRWADE